MSWPGVKVSHIFATVTFHRRKVMFAMLPDKRSLESSTLPFHSAHLSKAGQLKTQAGGHSNSPIEIL